MITVCLLFSAYTSFLLNRIYIMHFQWFWTIKSISTETSLKSLIQKLAHWDLNGWFHLQLVYTDIKFVTSIVFVWEIPLFECWSSSCELCLNSSKITVGAVILSWELLTVSGTARGFVTWWHHHSSLFLDCKTLEKKKSKLWYNVQPYIWIQYDFSMW